MSRAGSSLIQDHVTVAATKAAIQSVVLAGVRYWVVRPEGGRPGRAQRATVHGLTDDEDRGQNPTGRRPRRAAGRPGRPRPAPALRAKRDQVPRARVRAVLGCRAALADRRHARAAAPPRHDRLAARPARRGAAAVGGAEALRPARHRPHHAGCHGRRRLERTPFASRRVTKCSRPVACGVEPGPSCGRFPP